MIIAVHFRKGGVAKTTTTQHIGAAWALAGKSVLLIDTDGQGNLTRSFGVEGHQTGLATMFAEWIDGRDPVIEAREVRKNLWLIPGGPELYETEKKKIAEYDENRKSILKDMLGTLWQDRFDAVLIDTGPGDTWLVKNAMYAAHGVISPINQKAFAVDGVPDFRESLAELDRRGPDKPALYIPTHFDMREKEQKSYLDGFREAFGDSVTETVIGVDANLGKSQTEYKTIFEYRPKSRAAEQYRQLAREVEQWMQRHAG